MQKIWFTYAMFFALGCGVLYGQSASSVQSPPPGASVSRPGTATAAVSLGKGPSFTSAPLSHYSTGAEYRLSVIQWYMTFSSPLQIGDITLAGMGDEAAFDIYTLMANSQPMTAAQTLTALDIIHKAFAKPTAIQYGLTKPTNSLALLKMFEAAAVDQAVKERVATETNFLHAVPATVVPPPPGNYPPPPPGVPIGLF